MQAESEAIVGQGAVSRRQDISARAAKGMGLRLFWHILPILGAVILLWLLVVTSDLTWDQLVGVFEATSLSHVAAFTGLTVLMLALSAVKWRMVMVQLPSPDAAGAPPPSRPSSFLYTCLGAVLGIVMMPSVAKHAGRAMGARLHGGLPAGKSVAASLFEQIFDVALLVVLAGFGAILLAPMLAPFIAGVLVAVGVACAYMLRRPHLIPDRFHMGDLMRILRSPLALRLSSISLGIYLLTALRAFIVAVPAGIALLPAEFFASFSLVQLSRLIAITPMGLGIGDWSWATVLALLDLPLALAAGFVLLNRSLNIFATLAAFGLSVVVSVLVRRS
ncbi:MAG: lysylphosphatidylglycerol synthase domain-containing protein [Pseudomonadota bacterium]